MTEADWLLDTDLDAMMRVLHARGVSDRKLRLFICACCRRIWQFFQDPRSRRAVEIAEQFPDGLSVTKEVLYRTRADARAAYQDHTDSMTASAPLMAVYATYASAVTAAPLVQRHFPIHLLAKGSSKRTELAPGDWREIEAEKARLFCPLLRDLFGNPFRSATVDPTWLTPTVLALAQHTHDERAFDHLPILADALEEAGCTEATLLDHCRGPGPHVHGCWAVDLLLGKH